MKRIYYAGAAVGAVVLFASATGLAAEGVDNLEARLPESTNAIIAADVAYLREIPQAGRMRWVARGASPDGSPLLPSTAGVTYVCIAAHLNLDRVRPDWELALMRFGEVPSAEQVARQIGGYTDTIVGIAAAWSARGACFVRLDDHILVSAQPGDRQLIARWLSGLRSTGGAAPNVSSYLRAGAAMVTHQSPIVLAVDLRDAFAVPAVARWLQLNMGEATGKEITDPGAAAKVLTTIRGVTVRVSVGDGTSASATIDFDADTAPLVRLARPLFLDVLSRRGVAIADIDKWAFTTHGRVVTAEGPISDQGLRELLSVVQAPCPAENGSAEGGAQLSAAKAGANEKSSIADASRRYLDEVGAILDGIKPGASLADQAGWLWRDAKRIDQFPARGVDPDLLKWGAEVSADLRQAAAIFDAGQLRVTAAAQSGQVPVGSYSTGWYDTGSEQRDAQYRADVENYRRQNRQASAEIRAQVSQDANKSLQAALDSRGKIRAAMAERYGNEFK
jgi:hypothetical protein